MDRFCQEWPPRTCRPARLAGLFDGDAADHDLRQRLPRGERSLWRRTAGLGGRMKITDVSLTLFSWDDIPATQYGLTSRFAGSSALGLLCLRTDDGVEGHAFLGSASNSAAS